jgi:hypothetical protein
MITALVVGSCLMFESFAWRVKNVQVDKNTIVLEYPVTFRDTNNQNTTKEVVRPYYDIFKLNYVKSFGTVVKCPKEFQGLK